MLPPGSEYQNGVKWQDTQLVSTKNWRIAWFEKTHAFGVTSEECIGKQNFPFSHRGGLWWDWGPGCTSQTSIPPLRPVISSHPPQEVHRIHNLQKKPNKYYLKKSTLSSVSLLLPSHLGLCWVSIRLHTMSFSKKSCKAAALLFWQSLFTSPRPKLVKWPIFSIVPAWKVKMHNDTDWLSFPSFIRQFLRDDIAFSRTSWQEQFDFQGSALFMQRTGLMGLIGSSSQASKVLCMNGLNVFWIILFNGIGQSSWCNAHSEQGIRMFILILFLLKMHILGLPWWSTC